ncbi:ABC transporter substrate-binding protein [Acidomonas methanolica]|uniref:ABC transporter toluene transporter auxiliary component n=1 Tax=Acidomonas methanolica NBRC 104435 TaxID=1231351 RepID=A0A023D195_ACIMT|nr:ABC transporter substrate-binding protein [Acidomonas methanolica]TCS31218.1 phospholipid transport system substrate-binding protein [Acidomonas methanolica]GAJ27928.1 ABC transporter toluene transporter auxiliary component [Acidomonas methanolica NBRC 104435]GEK98535.1 hypothetical protein AME01nite_10340 [Acidomonas methanolica NBRC 104435]
MPISRVFARRVLLGLAAVATMAVSGARPALADEASDFVKSFGGQLVAIVNSDEPLEKKKQDVLPLLQKNLDIAEIGKFCLGRYWRAATPEQQKRYLSLFDHVLVNAITDRIGDYRGVTFIVTGTSHAPTGELVSAKIDRPGQPEADMQLLVVNNSGYKVVDMIGEGASLRLTQRQDYSAYLQRHNGNVNTLNDALQRQIEHHH